MSIAGSTTDQQGVSVSEIPPDAIRSACDAIVTSSVFDGSPRLTNFLKFVTEETLAGRAERLKEYSIAISVFDQKESFDPQTNTIVRVQAGRLRRRLEMYYLTVGSGDSLRITVPKGGYVPSFERQGPIAPESTHEPAVEEKAQPKAELPKRSNPSIAVLPFDNYSVDPGDKFFADGLTEEIIANLARFKDLFVFSRSTTAKMAQDGIDIRQLRDQLGVDFVIEGSVRKSGSAVRVTVQLIDATQDGHVFAEQYDRPSTPENMFEIQDEIAMLVAGRVADRYGPLGRYAARASRAGVSKNWETYLWILRFYDYYAAFDLDAHLQVRDGLAKALERDPESSDGWAALSIILLDEYRFHANERPGYPALDEALSQALRAVSTDPENAFAYQALAMAYYMNGEFADFEIAAERALELNPGHADVNADMGTCYCVMGDWDRGLPLVRRAIELSPVHPGWYHMGPAVHYFLQGDYAAAKVEMRKGQMPGFFWYHAILIAILGEMGDKDGVASELTQLLETYPNFAENALAEIGIWQFHKEMIDKLIAGWRAAGLEIG